MEHRVGHRKLQRNTSHRLAMLRSLVAAVLERERIRTTVPKAKEARRLVERVITLGKRGGVHNIRLARRYIVDRELLGKVFGGLKDRYAARAGGYTRIVRVGRRQGDGAEMVILELVDGPAVQVAEPAK